MKRKMVAMVVAAVIGIAGAIVQVRSQQQRPLIPVKIQKLKDSLWVICSQGDDCPIIGAGGNIAVRETPEGVIIVDDKYAQDYQNILAAVKTVTSQPIKYVINTHSHGDHTGGNAQFLNIAEVIAQKNARDNMVRGKQPGLPRIVFTDQTAVYLGGVEVEAQYKGRGHTNGDAVIYFPDLKVIHTGDLLNENTPFNVDYANGGSATEWIKTFDEILKLDFDTVIPGHGKIMTRAQFQTYRNRMDTLLQRLTQLVRQGTKKEEIAMKLKADDLGWDLNLPAPNANFMQKVPQIYDEIAAKR